MNQSCRLDKRAYYRTMHDATQDSAATQPWHSDARAAGLVGLAHLISHFFQMLLPPIYPWLMRDFDIGFTRAGFLATVFFVISSSGQALAGFAVDRIGAYRVLLVGIGFLVAAGTMLGMSHSYAGLLATAALAGSGNAMFHPADFTILNHRVSSSRLGHAFAMHALSGNFGWVAGASFMAAVTTFAGWHIAGFGAAAIALGMLLFLLTQRGTLAGSFGPRHAERTPANESGVRPGPFDFLRSGTVWLCFVFFFLSVGAGGILQNFAPAILAHVYSASLTLGTMSLTAYLLGGGVGTVFGGFVAGRQRRSELVVACALCLAAAIALALATGSVPLGALLPAVFLLGCGSGTAGPSRDLLVRQAATSRFGVNSFGRVYGFVYSGLDGGLAIAPLLVGRLLDHGWFRSGLVCIAALQISATFVALRVGQRSRVFT